MIELAQGNLLEATADALVNTVNCVGVMGKGIALQFKQAFPENFHSYEKACRSGEVQLGKMFIVPTESLLYPKFIINFPTKGHWKAKSHLDDIQTGLTALVKDLSRLHIHSIALPPLGCGNGGLDWSDVYPLIKSAFEELPNVHVYLFAPSKHPESNSMPVTTDLPAMTRGRALLIRLMDIYREPSYLLGLLEIQKLAYFLQIAGEPLKLNFVKHKYGPYAENLNHVLQRIEGHYIRGYGDRASRAEINLLPGASDSAQQVLSNVPEAEAHLTRVAGLIRGFESPYGMELLATVHWVAREDPDSSTDFDKVLAGVQKWSPSKKARLKTEHIQKAWLRLRNENWI